MKKKTYILDKGFVEYMDHMGSDLTVVNSARVSFDSSSDWEYYDKTLEPEYYSDGSLSRTLVERGGKKLSEKDKKLIAYLATNKHWTPFGHSQITLRIKAPISIRTQLFKSKIGFCENEISRRYVSFEPEFYHPRWRSKPNKSIKQGSGDFIAPDEDGGEVSGGLSYHPLYRDYEAHMKLSIKLYEDLINMGVAPEQARFSLPQGMYTEWYWTGSLFAYARMFNQRIHPNAQWETREYAKSIGCLLNELFPESWKCLTKGVSHES